MQHSCPHSCPMTYTTPLPHSCSPVTCRWPSTQAGLSRCSMGIRSKSSTKGKRNVSDWQALIAPRKASRSARSRSGQRLPWSSGGRWRFRVTIPTSRSGLLPKLSLSTERTSPRNSSRMDGAGGTRSTRRMTRSLKR